MYSLNANSVNNCQQTGPVNLQTNFIQYSPGATPSYMDVVINEIIGDVSPVVGLPQTEFIELYNRTNLTFNLENWKISSQSGTSAPTILTLPSFFLRPDTFVVICTSADKDSFLSAGIQVINPDVFNTNFLTTTGKTLQLLDSVGGILDSVSYLPTWYQDNTKDNGGWTIEKINPGDTCSLPSANWIASNDPSGGTPGRTNSVLNLTPPTTPPAVASVLITGASQVKICFTQKMDGITVNQIGNYAITNYGLCLYVFRDYYDFCLNWTCYGFY
ncbi:MAG: lamin tail domain-containing protein [Chitinophagia bacterium]|nr:lamin tail domain-containing protein [Chitinophagia bacterium]